MGVIEKAVVKYPTKASQYNRVLDSLVPIGGIIKWDKALVATTGTPITSGAADTNTADHLVDSGGDFSGVSAGDIVKNVTDSTFAYVVSVDSSTDLELDWDCFPLGTETYQVYDEPELTVETDSDTARFVECNGSAISDSDSDLDGLTTKDIPPDPTEDYLWSLLRIK